MTCFSDLIREDHLNLSEVRTLSGHANFRSAIVKHGEGAASANRNLPTTYLPGNDLYASAPLQLFHHQNNFSFF